MGTVYYRNFHILVWLLGPDWDEEQTDGHVDRKLGSGSLGSQLTKSLHPKTQRVYYVGLNMGLGLLWGYYTQINKEAGCMV